MIPAEENGPVEEVSQRTELRGLMIAPGKTAFQAALPIGVAIFAQGDDWITSLIGIAAAFAGILLLTVVVSYLQWTRLRYTLGASDIRVESGLLSRKVRSVPFERIQDVSVEQGPLARMLSLVQLGFETGAGAGEDLSLAYVSVEEGKRLRAVVRDRVAQAAGAPVEAGLAEAEEEAAPLLFAMDMRRVLILGVFNFSLVVFALVGGFFAQFDELLPFDLWDFDRWQELIAGPGAWLAGLGPWARAVGVAVLLLVLVLSGVVTGLATTVLREWGFRLERTERGFRRRRGLLTRTEMVLPVRRVQAVITHTGAIRARFGWHALSLVSLAADAGAANHAIAPLAKHDEIDPLILEAGFTPAGNGVEWQRVTRAFIWVEMLDRMRWWIVFALIVSGSQWYFQPDGWLAMRWLAAVPLTIGIWRALRLGMSLLRTHYAIDEAQLYLRSGWLAPYMLVCPREKLHSATIAQGPVARRLDYAALTFGLAGGSASIPGLPLEAAHRLRDTVLQSMKRRDFSAIV